MLSHFTAFGILRMRARVSMQQPGVIVVYARVAIFARKSAIVFGRTRHAVSDQLSQNAIVAASSAASAAG